MSTISARFSLQTDADPDDVVAYLADFRNQPAWRPDVLTADLRDGRPGAATATFRQLVREGPGTSVRDIRVTTEPVDGGRAIRFQTLGEAPALAAGVTTVLASDGGSAVTSSIEITFRGQGELLRPVVSGVLRRRMVSYEKRLGSVLHDLTTADRPG